MKFFLSLAVLLAPLTSAYAFPMPKDGMTVWDLPTGFTANYDFEGIVALNNCSGSLIRFEGAADSDAAYVLTNGHCVETGFAKAGEVTTHHPSQRTFKLFDSAIHAVGRLTATEIVYSTMTNTDITLYKLNDTYAAIQAKFKIRPLMMASQHPAEGQVIDVLSGYWERGYECKIETFIPQLKEDAWTFVDSVRYSRPGCDTIGGTSGSPVLSRDTRAVIAINNTGNEDGEECTMNNPCEVDKNGKVSFQQGYSYAQQTYWIYSCLDANHQLDLTLPGCKLPH